ncbi:MAG: alpha/beta fold hydrolase [Microthrixaceae bacterium]
MTGIPIADRPTLLRHGRIDLALWTLRSGEGRPLLLLHGLGEHTVPIEPEWTATWPGPVYGLDFTGHGASTLPRGGGYTAEMLMADADAALAHLGEASLVGRGLGAYIALMLAGSRPAQVYGAVLCDGPGLSGGGVQPGGTFVTVPRFGHGTTPDPFAMVELNRDIRPPDYAAQFVRLGFERSPVPDPLLVAAIVRPEWLATVVAQPGVRTMHRDRALAELARTVSG